MPKFAQRTFVSFCILCLLLSSFPFPIPAEASGVSCSVTTSPNQVASGSTNNFPISITNTSSLNIVWIHIVRPSVNFTLGSVLASGWSGNQTTTETTLNGGTISSGLNPGQQNLHYSCLVLSEGQKKSSPDPTWVATDRSPKFS